MNEFDEYLKNLGEVTPLAYKGTQHSLPKKRSSDSKMIRARQANAQSIWTQDNNFLSVGEVEWISPDDLIAFKKDGVQHGVYKSLRLGKYQIQAVLNLKGKSLEEARRVLFEFIQQSLELNNRCLLIQHGNGMNSSPPKATLKSYLNDWLPQFDEVLAFHSALKSHGGNASTYVLIKKSDDARLHNKERYQKRHHHQ